MRGAATTTSSTPAARAVTTPITTDDGYGCAAAGRVDRGAADRQLAQAHGLALRAA